MELVISEELLVLRMGRGDGEDGLFVGRDRRYGKVRTVARSREDQEGKGDVGGLVEEKRDWGKVA